MKYLVLKHSPVTVSGFRNASFRNASFRNTLLIFIPHQFNTRMTKAKFTFERDENYSILLQTENAAGSFITGIT